MTKTKTGATTGNAAADKVQVVHADVQSTTEAGQWHREAKIPARLRHGHSETRLTKWLRRETWTPHEAALLVHGFDPDTYTADYMGQGKKMATGLCGGAFLGDAAFSDAEGLAQDWGRCINASEKVVPGEFVLWCLGRGIDAGWLKEVPLPVERSYTPLEHAAWRLARKQWPPHNGSLALRNLEKDGWRNFPSPAVALETLCGELGLEIPRPGQLDKRLDAPFRKVFYGEGHARAIMQKREQPNLQTKIDALLAADKVRFYEWPSRIPTKDRKGAWVNESELIALLIDGQHLDASQQAVAPRAPHSAPLAAPVVAESASGGAGEAWKERARARADEIIKRQHAIDLYPSQEHIADEIAKEFRQSGVTGADGKPLAGSYIKRHALKGISSAQGKQISTSIGRGK